MSKVNIKPVKLSTRDYDILMKEENKRSTTTVRGMQQQQQQQQQKQHQQTSNRDSFGLNSDDLLGKRKTILDFFTKASLQKQMKMEPKKDVNGRLGVRQEKVVKTNLNNNNSPNVIDLSGEDDSNIRAKNIKLTKSSTISINGARRINMSTKNISNSMDDIEIIDDDEGTGVSGPSSNCLDIPGQEPLPFTFCRPIKPIKRESTKDDDDVKLEKLKDKNFMKIEDFLQIVIDTKSDSSATSSDTKENNPPQQEWLKDYKLKHFRDMLDSVLKDNHYSHLFDDLDWQIIYKFTHLSYAAQALYLRLLVRKPNWIRTKNMNYPDIENIGSKLNELVRSKLLLSADHLTNFSEALNCLDANEIKIFAKHLKGIATKPNITKGALIEAIKKHVRLSKSITSHFMVPSGSSSYSIDGQVLSQIKRMIGNTCYRIERQAARVFLRIALIRFQPSINDDDDGGMLSAELYNLERIAQGELKFVPYSINKYIKVFPRRNHLILFEEACNLESDLMQAIESRNHQMAIDSILPKIQTSFDNLTQDIHHFYSTLPPYLRRFTSGHVLTRALTTCVTILEQKKSYPEAVALLEKLLAQRLYCLDYRGKWFERLTLNYDKHLKRTIEAIEVIRLALQDTYVKGGHRYSLYLRSKKLGLVDKGKVSPLPEFQFKLKQTTIKAPTLKQCIEGRKNIFVSSKDNGTVETITVEQVVIEYYNKQGYNRGIHCEGVIYNSLFCLLFWKIIYSDDLVTSDAFHSPYQRVPLDLNFNEFYQRRLPLIRSKLQTIKLSTKEELMNEIDSVWDTYNGCASLVNWEKCTPGLLKEIVSCMKINTLAAICERLAKDYRSHRAGFPDVLLWSPATKSIKAVEVKGPGDQVSPKQALWINYLETHGLESEIVFVKVGRSEIDS